MSPISSRNSVPPCVLEQPCLVMRGPGEGALQMAEELTFKQRLDYRGAVEHHVPAGGDWAEFLDRAGYEVFTGSGLASD
jgi:hypothetical protein